MKFNFSYEDDNEIYSIDFNIENYSEDLRVKFEKFIFEFPEDTKNKIIDWLNKVEKSINKKSNLTGIKDFINKMKFYDHLKNQEYHIEDINNIDYNSLYELCLLTNNKFDIKFDFENILMEDNDIVYMPVCRSCFREVTGLSAIKKN